MFDLSHFDLYALLPYIAVGFAAQLVDGALGMAFGVITSTMLVGVLGLPPAQASQRVHIVEMFTTAVSGISHILHRNVDFKLFLKLAIPGAIGGYAGARFLSSVPGDVIKPYILAYLSLMGLYLLARGFFWPPKVSDAKVVVPLGLAGGFLDAVGGGGWGPVVTSNLLAQGAEPRKVVGTVNTVEFLVTATISGTFIFHLGLSDIAGATLGLLIGGVAAAPLGAFAAKRFSPKVMLVLVGIVLTATSVYSLLRALKVLP